MDRGAWRATVHRVAESNITQVTLAAAAAAAAAVSLHIKCIFTCFIKVFVL